MDISYTEKLESIIRSFHDYCSGNFEQSDDAHEFLVRELSSLTYKQLHTYSQSAASDEGLPKISLIEGPSENMQNHPGEKIAGVKMDMPSCGVYIKLSGVYENE